MTVEVVEAKTPEVICTWLAEKTSLHSRFKSLTLRKIDAESVRTKSSSLFDGIDGR